MGAKQNPVRQKVNAFLVGIVLLFVFGHGSTVCRAHTGNIASGLAKVAPDGSFTLRLHFDVLSYAVGALPNHGDEDALNALLDGSPAVLETQLTEAKKRFRQNFRVAGGGAEAIDLVTFPHADDIISETKTMRVRLPVMAFATVSGHLPPGMKTVSFQFDQGLGPVVLTTEFPYQEPVSEPIEAGAWSETRPVPSKEAVAKSAAVLGIVPSPSAAPPPPIAATSPVRPAAPQAAVPPKPPVKIAAVPKPTILATPAPPALLPSAPPKPAVAKPAPPASVPPASSPAAAPSPPPKPSIAPVPPALTAAPSPASPAVLAPSDLPTQNPQLRWLTHFFRYIKMGYTHILPEGIDHILFILGLFLLSTRIKPLLQQVTAFTLAHSLTLALSLYGIFRLPASFVEPVIAASIAFVAVENLLTNKVKPWRIATVFGFGLIHGLGFAAALQELGLQQKDLLSALLGFNVGVELGQLSVVLGAFLLVGWFRNRPGYRKFVIVPGSLAIAAVALFWMVQRIWF